MDMPRCKTCKHWGVTGWYGPHEKFRDCERLANNTPRFHVNGPDSRIDVAADFACVEHEERT